MQKWNVVSQQYNRPPTMKRTLANIVRRIRIIFDFRTSAFSSPANFPDFLSSSSPCEFYSSTDYFAEAILGMACMRTRGLVFPRCVKENERDELNDIGKRTYEAFANRVENNGYAHLLFSNDTERSLNSIEGRCPREYP